MPYNILVFASFISNPSRMATQNIVFLIERQEDSIFLFIDAKMFYFTELTSNNARSQQHKSVSSRLWAYTASTTNKLRKMVNLWFPDMFKAQLSHKISIYNRAISVCHFFEHSRHWFLSCLFEIQQTSINWNISPRHIIKTW